MEKVQDLVNEIHGTRSQVTGSRKDEIRVLKAMLNDTSYCVDVYDRNGKVGEFCPAKTMREVSASIISGTTKISNEEATGLVANYEFTKNESEGMLDVFKEFFHTYLHTGRKLNMGGREKSDIAISLKEIQAGTRSFPKSVGIDDNGKPIYERGVTKVDGYESARVYAPCPSWIRNK